MVTARPTACFAGTRLEAMLAFQRYMNIVSILTTPDSWVHRYCQTNSIVAHLVQRQSKEKSFRFLEEQSVQWVLSAGFPYILPLYVLNSGSNYINSHPALLPSYKGANAIRAAVENREEYMGVTVHYMVQEVDAGKTICQEKVWVRGLSLQEIYDLMFSVVEPMTISRAMENLLRSQQ